MEHKCVDMQEVIEELDYWLQRFRKWQMQAEQKDYEMSCDMKKRADAIDKALKALQEAFPYLF